MNTVQRIAKNTGVLLVSQIVSYVLGFFFVMYTARYLGAEGFGVLSFALAFTGIFGVFSDLGLGTLMVREVARDKSLVGKYLANIITIKLILIAITFGLIILAINILGYPGQTVRVVYLIGLSVIFGAFSNIFSSIFQAHERMEYVSIIGILNSALMLLGALFVINHGLGIDGFASIYFIVGIIVLAYNFIVCSWKFILPKIEIDWNFWYYVIKEAIPFGLSGIFITVYYWVDSVMLSIMVGNEVVGWYNAAYRLVLVLLSIYTAYIISIFPIMSRFYHKKSGDLLKIIYDSSFRYLTIVSIPIATGTTLLADRIILLVYGTEYTQSIAALQVLIWTIVFMFLSGLSANLLASINRQIVVVKVTGIGAVINIALNLLIIPRFSYIGASISTVFTELAVLSIFMYVISKTEYKPQIILNKDILKIIASVLPIVVIIRNANNINLILVVIMCALIYFCAIYMLNVLNKNDVTMMKSLYTREKHSYFTEEGGLSEK